MIACAGLTEEAMFTASFVGIALILLSTIFYASNVVYISLYLPNNLSRTQAAARMMIFGRCQFGSIFQSVMICP